MCNFVYWNKSKLSPRWGNSTCQTIRVLVRERGRERESPTRDTSYWIVDIHNEINSKTTNLKKTP